MASPQSLTPEQKLQIVQRAQRDPAWWMEQGCGWGLWQRQREIAKALIQHERVAVDACFGCGKTYLAARIALWWLHNHFPSKVITTAPTGRQVKQLLWSEIRTAHKRSLRKLGGEPLTTKLELDADWFAVGFATDSDKMDQFTGYHSPNTLVIFDQANGVERGIWEAAEGLMTSDYCRWLAISNTTDSTSAMAEISRCACEGVTTPLGKWHTMKITAHETPNVLAGRNLIPGIISWDWVNKKREVWNPNDPMWQIFVEANYVEDALMIFLTGQMIRDMFDASVEVEPNFNDIKVAIDVADEGLDSTVYTVGAGGRLLFIDQVYGNDPMQVANKAVEVWERAERQTGHTPQIFRVDKIGVGSGVAARLSELGYNVDGINVSVSPLRDEEQFLNLRAELGWSIRKAAEAKEISLVPLYPTPPHFISMLKEEMTVRYKIMGSGKIRMEPKDDIRKRLRRSPDFWDSMMLCFGDCDDHPQIHTVQTGTKEHPVGMINGLAQHQRLVQIVEDPSFLLQENDPRFEAMFNHMSQAGTLF